MLADWVVCNTNWDEGTGASVYRRMVRNMLITISIGLVAICNGIGPSAYSGR
jgi:hypothetical protein